MGNHADEGVAPEEISRKQLKIMVLHGPNLNLLGLREPGVYGKSTLAEIDEAILQQAGEYDLEVEIYQSNHEGVLIDMLQQARDRCHGIIFNPGAYTHYSVALRDAVSAVDLPVVEVHLSNIHAREAFRSTSLIAPVALGQISGLGRHSYLAALQALKHYLEE